MFKKWLRNIMKIFNPASSQTDFAILICDFMDLLSNYVN